MLSSPASRSALGDSEDNSENNDPSENQFESQIISPVKAPRTPADAFSRELTRLQEEQVVYLKKIEKEKQRKEQLDETMEEAKLRLRLIRDKTKNGNIVKDHNMTNQKLLGRLEHQLQMSKIKLSTSKNENITLKNKVQDLRREKLLHLQILNDLGKEISNARRRAKYCQKEIISINEKKHKVKAGIASIKQKMVRDMEEFSSELVKAKQTINNTQVNIMSTIREKLQQSSVLDEEESPSRPPDTANKIGFSQSFKKGFNSLKGVMMANTNEFNYTLNTTMKRPHTRHEAYHTNSSTSTMNRPTTASAAASISAENSRTIGHNPQDAELYLKETEFSSVEEMLQALQHSEETVFALYNETQSKHEEVEKMELDNKYLESKVQDQMKKLHELEGNQEQVKQELEKNIQYFQSMITKYEADYQKNLEVLKSITEHLLTLLKNVAVDEAALDQQLLSTGITDRNVGEFLGLIEQRIDDLIQMSKAANHQNLRKEDFLKLTQSDKVGFQVPIPPAILETEEDEDIEAAGENARLQPLNIPVLKEIMNKKVQKMSLLPVYINSASLNKNPGGNGSRSSRIGGQSTASLKSLDSNKST